VIGVTQDFAGGRFHSFKSVGRASESEKWVTRKVYRSALRFCAETNLNRLVLVSLATVGSNKWVTCLPRVSHETRLIPLRKTIRIVAFFLQSS
jgi:hypothetical protein